MVLQLKTLGLIALTLMMLIGDLLVLRLVVLNPSRGPQEPLEEESATLYFASNVFKVWLRLNLRFCSLDDNRNHGWLGVVKVEGYGVIGI